jgi:hypothetical protein
MGLRALMILLCLVACFGEPVRGQGGATDNLLRPRTLTLKADGISLSKALAEVCAKTGNQVADRRQVKTDPKLDLNLVKSAFWPALDTIAKAAGCGVSTYQPGGHVALIDRPARSLATSYQGIFRIVAKRVSVARDDDAGTHVCTVTLNIAWEPRFEPLYLAIGPAQAIFAADNQGAELKTRSLGNDKLNLAERGAVDVEMSMPAPHRSSAAIKKLQGQFQLTSPGKMLAFAFPNLTTSGAARSQTEDGVKVSLAPLKPATRRWSVEVTIDNPSGNPGLESYQSWLGNNSIGLEKGTGAEHKIWRPVPGDELIEKESVDQARILYSFRVSPTDPPGFPADWTLFYRTPGRIAVIDVPYDFNDLRLP